MSDVDGTTPRFQWRYQDDSGWSWSTSHTVEGPCSGCCPTDALRACPNCGGRLHREPAFAGDHLSETLFCQQERVDGLGRSTRMRGAESQAQVAARVAAMQRQHGERVDKWIGRAVGGLVAVKVALAVVFVAAIALGTLTHL